MNTSNTAYWHIVHDCLTQFQEIPAPKALDLVRALRRSLLNAPRGVDASIIFHEEPYRLAQRLAGREEAVFLAQHRNDYDRIVQQRTLEAAALGGDEEVLELRKAG